MNLNANHWAVICAIKDRRVFYYIDPFVASQGDIEIAFKNWKKFMKSRPVGEFPAIEKWQIGNFTHDKQPDLVSCGVLCCKFIETLIIDNETTCKYTKDSITDFRLHFLSLINSHI